MEDCDDVSAARVYDHCPGLISVFTHNDSFHSGCGGIDIALNSQDLKRFSGMDEVIQFECDSRGVAANISDAVVHGVVFGIRCVRCKSTVFRMAR